MSQILRLVFLRPIFVVTGVRMFHGSSVQSPFEHIKASQKGGQTTSPISQGGLLESLTCKQLSCLHDGYLLCFIIFRNSSPMGCIKH